MQHFIEYFILCVIESATVNSKGWIRYILRGKSSEFSKVICSDLSSKISTDLAYCQIRRTPSPSDNLTLKVTEFYNF